MKTIITATLLTCMATLAIAQKSTPEYRLAEEKNVSDVKSTNPDVIADWTPYNVIFRETFDSSQWHTAQADGVAIPANMPAGWTAVDNTGNDFFWRWSVDGPRGRYTNSYAWNQPNQAHRPNSTSDADPNGENGFMLLESDFFNTTPEGELANPQIVMDTYIQYGPMNMSGAEGVRVYFEQWHRQCCASYSEAVGHKLYISVNGTEWIQYSVHSSGIGSTPKYNPAIRNIDLSNHLTGQNTVYFRFHWIGHTHYHWSIDDVTFYEPHAHDARLLYFWMDYAHERMSFYNDSNYKKLFSATPYFSPYHSFQKFVSSRALVGNMGHSTLSNVALETKIRKNGTEIYSSSSSALTSLVANQWDSLEHTEEYQIPAQIASMGSYQISGLIVADEEDLAPHDNQKFYDFNITDNLYGFANPDFAATDRQSPLSYTGTVDGDGVGIVVMIDTPQEVLPGTSLPSPHLLQGVNVFIKDDSYNWDIWRAGNVANLQVELYEGTLVDDAWEFDFTAPVISSALTPIDSNFVSKWAYIPFIPEENNQFLVPPAMGTHYFALVRMFTNNLRFFIGADKMTQPSYYSNLLCFGNSFGWTGSETNIAMELIVNTYGTSPTSSIQFTVQSQTTSEPLPATGAILTFYTNDTDMNVIASTYTVDNTGIVDIEGLRSGSYSYKVEYQGEVKTGSVTATGAEATKEILFNIVGIENQPLANTLKLYPNPVQNLLTVETANEPQQIEIANLLGQTLKTVVNPTDSQTVDISGLATGVYVVTVVDRGNGRTSKMFVKQ